MSDQYQVSPDNLQYNVTVTDAFGNQIYYGGYASVNLQAKPPQITIWDGAFTPGKSFTRGAAYTFQGNPSLGSAGSYWRTPAQNTHEFTIDA